MLFLTSRPWACSYKTSRHTNIQADRQGVKSMSVFQYKKKQQKNRPADRHKDRHTDRQCLPISKTILSHLVIYIINAKFPNLKPQPQGNSYGERESLCATLPN